MPHKNRCVDALEKVYVVPSQEAGKYLWRLNDKVNPVELRVSYQYSRDLRVHLGSLNLDLFKFH